MTSTNIATGRSVPGCVARLRRALDDRASRSGGDPVVGRKVRSLLAQSGRKKVTAAFVDELARELRAGGLYTNRELTRRPLFQDDQLRFSMRPFPPAEVFFPLEADLVEFMRHAVGTVPPLEGLREVQTGRSVRGIIISGPERFGHADTRPLTRHRIDWYYYTVKLSSRPAG